MRLEILTYTYGEGRSWTNLLNAEEQVNAFLLANPGSRIINCSATSNSADDWFTIFTFVEVPDAKKTEEKALEEKPN